MTAKYILAALAIAFAIASVARFARDGGRPRAQSGTWLLIAGLFGVVSAWLFSQGS